MNKIYLYHTPPFRLTDFHTLASPWPRNYLGWVDELSSIEIFRIGIASYRNTRNLLLVFTAKPQVKMVML